MRAGKWLPQPRRPARRQGFHGHAVQYGQLHRVLHPRSPGQDLTDVIAATDPTVFSNGVTGAWSENYAIRGFASNTSDTTFNGLSGMAPYYRTSPEMFERIEVLKGPSALLNGMPPGGSVGGSVNLVPKRASEQPLLRVSANFASDAQFGTHVDMGRRLGADRKFGIRFNGAYRDGDGAVGKQQEGTARFAGTGLARRTYAAVGRSVQRRRPR